MRYGRYIAAAVLYYEILCKRMGTLGVISGAFFINFVMYQMVSRQSREGSAVYLSGTALHV